MKYNEAINELIRARGRKVVKCPWNRELVQRTAWQHFVVFTTRSWKSKKRNKCLPVPLCGAVSFGFRICQDPSEIWNPMSSKTLCLVHLEVERGCVRGVSLQNRSGGTPKEAKTKKERGSWSLRSSGLVAFACHKVLRFCSDLSIFVACFAPCKKLSSLAFDSDTERSTTTTCSECSTAIHINEPVFLLNESKTPFQLHIRWTDIVERSANHQGQSSFRGAPRSRDWWRGGAQFEMSSLWFLFRQKSQQNIFKLYKNTNIDIKSYRKMHVTCSHLLLVVQSVHFLDVHG